MKISVVILVHGNFKYFAACLKSCYEQDYQDKEIIIINDLLWTADQVDEIIAGRDIFHYIIPAPVSIGVARGFSTWKADGDIIAFVDSDVVLPAPQWLTHMIAPFVDPDVSIVHTTGKFHDDDPIMMKYVILSNPIFEDTIPGTGNTLYRKSAIIEAGGFKDMKAGEDLDLAMRMKRKRVYLPDEAVYHYHCEGLLELLRKQWRNSKYCEAAGIHGNNFNNKRGRIVYSSIRFITALIGEENPAWLLWPVAGTLQLITSKVAPIW